MKRCNATIKNFKNGNPLTPLVLSSPHSGKFYPKEFLKSVTNDYELNLALVLAISIMPRLKAKGKEIVKDVIGQKIYYFPIS